MARVSAMRIITAKTTDFAVPKLKASVIQCCATCLVDIIDCACSCPPTYACARAVCLYIRYSTKTFIIDQTDTRLHGFVSCVHVHCPLVSCINVLIHPRVEVILSIIINKYVLTADCADLVVTHGSHGIPIANSLPTYLLVPVHTCINNTFESMLCTYILQT